MDFRDSIPGYREAVEKEQLNRDAAFLGLTETIGDFEVVPLTLLHLLVLRIMRSPFLSSKPPESAQDIIRFLWLLHPQYDPAGGFARQELARRCAQFTVPTRPWLRTRRAMVRYEKRCLQVMKRLVKITAQIRAYLAEAMADWPASGSAHGTSFFSDACAVCGLLGREHHRSQEWVMNAPIKVLFQYLNEIRDAHGKPGFNPSDRLVNDWLRNNQDPDSLLGQLMAGRN